MARAFGMGSGFFLFNVPDKNSQLMLLLTAAEFILSPVNAQKK